MSGEYIYIYTYTHRANDVYLLFEFTSKLKTRQVQFPLIFNTKQSFFIFLRIQYWCEQFSPNINKSDVFLLLHRFSSSVSNALNRYNVDCVYVRV